MSEEYDIEEENLFFEINLFLATLVSLVSSIRLLVVITFGISCAISEIYNSANLLETLSMSESFNKLDNTSNGFPS